MTDFEYDAFISHASEDKTGFVTPLANELKKYGLKVWFDKFTLRIGDSLHNSIEKGLASSRYGIVVFSPKFLSKNWPRAELNGLFASEMEGHKVILPIWHNVSSAEMNAVLPMQADKYALRSSDGIENVTRALIEVIRPELLELERRKLSAFEAGESFIAEARRKHPGFDFSVQSGPMTGSDPNNARFTITNSGRRIQIHPIAAKDLGGRIQFFGDGVKKAIEFQRTGKPQKWESGEFALLDWNIPLMPSHSEGSTMEVGPKNLQNIPARHMRVEVGSPPIVVFPMMEMRSVRMGTDEAEATLSDRETALQVSMVFPVGPNSQLDFAREVEFTLSWETTGKRASECRKLIDAVDALRRGAILRFIDIRLDRAIFESKASVPGRADPFAGPLRRTILLASLIEREFSVSLRMPEVISEEDGESLFHLDCLLNGREYGRAGNATASLVKADGELGEIQTAFIKGESCATVTDVPANYPGYFPLFGQRVFTPPWIRVMKFVPLEPEADTKAFADLPLSTEFIVKMIPISPTYLRWKGKDFEPLPADQMNVLPAPNRRRQGKRKKKR